MPYITVGAENSGPIDLYYEDHGAGQPVVLIHGFPFNGATWEKVSTPLLAAGYRVITYDRRGFGNSSQPSTGYDYDTLAADLDTLMNKLDLRDVILAGHSMGTGEVTRYLGAYGSRRVARAVLLAPLAPFLLKTADNPEGVDGGLFRGFQAAILADRFAYLTQFCEAFFNWDETRGDLVSEEAFRAHWEIGARGSAKGTHDCVSAWLTDFRGDLPRIDVPVLIVQGDQDNVLPYEKTGRRLQPMLPDARLVTLAGAPHGIPWTHATEVTRAMLEFAGATAMSHA
ncbi:alpha/beta hydrolase [Dactylosporangium aurantiacum]|uniref:Alpha/beta hydrolase n=1 Tax=Dactylosporangium aurantiacum TaxID=35754 RepID=A0A9Q9IAI3_9ACTN|nr:alpha/beta hydrolase [Dactylosporangium aurantiacum]MDG6101749.1 alpha/beta hydrolase [Dactylosporangium aurantiacum]UWZ52442.1 alpha/beta hydrolase [Dactylosporangium aurantiacum]